MAETVADPTDDSTLCPNLEPKSATRDHFEPFDCPQFPPKATLPPEVNLDDLFAIWSLFFTSEIMQMIV
jgi:hypothetical protein